jgi:hypothetical protein
MEFFELTNVVFCSFQDFMKTHQSIDSVYLRTMKSYLRPFEQHFWHKIQHSSYFKLELDRHLSHLHSQINFLNYDLLLFCPLQLAHLQI